MASTGQVRRSLAPTDADCASVPPAAESSTDSSDSYRAILERLANAQKPTKGAPAYSRFINRKAGRMIAAAAYRVGLTPNSLTAVSAVLTFASIAALVVVQPSWPAGVLIALGLAVGYAFDAADGQLARLRGGGSFAGEWLDHMVDSTKASSIHLAVLVSLFRYHELSSTAWLFVPIGFAVVAPVMFFGMTLNDQLRRQHKAAGGEPVGPTRTSALRSMLVVPTDYGLICWSFVLLGSPTIFFGIYVALFVGNAGFLLLASVKWFKDMRALDASGRSSAA